jgi:hypothetical protein
MPDTQDNTAASSGQQLTNTGSETITTKDIGDLNLLLGNTTPAGTNTQEPDSSSTSSTAALSGSAEGKQGNGASGAQSATDGSTTALNSDASSSIQTSQESSSAPGTDAGNAGAASASAAEAGAATSSGAQSGESSSSTQQTANGSESTSQAAAIAQSTGDAIQSGASSQADLPASSLTEPTSPAGDSPQDGATSNAGLAPAVMDSEAASAARAAALATPDTDLGNHPAAEHIDAIVEQTVAAKAIGLPAELAEYVEVKARMIRIAIANEEAAAHRHFDELLTTIESIAHVPEHIITFVRTKVTYLRSIL